MWYEFEIFFPCFSHSFCLSFCVKSKSYIGYNRYVSNVCSWCGFKNISFSIDTYRCTWKIADNFPLDKTNSFPIYYAVIYSFVIFLSFSKAHWIIQKSEEEGERKNCNVQFPMEQNIYFFHILHLLKLFCIWAVAISNVFKRYFTDYWCLIWNIYLFCILCAMWYTYQVPHLISTDFQLTHESEKFPKHIYVTM